MRWNPKEASGKLAARGQRTSGEADWGLVFDIEEMKDTMIELSKTNAYAKLCKYAEENDGKYDRPDRYILLYINPMKWQKT